MDHKIQKTKPKTTADGEAAAPADAPSQQLLIHSRPMASKSINVRTPEDELLKAPEKPEPLATPSKRSVIAPPEGPSPKSDASAETPAQPTGTKSIDDIKSPSQPPEPASTSPDSTLNAPVADRTSDKASDSNDAPAAIVESETDTVEADEPLAADTKKVAEEAAKLDKRQQEIEGYIESREFYVPINTVARKRSIKVSFVLTIVIFLLALVLLDLMLDSGMILLVQKIPHTHFFTVMNTLGN